MAMGAPVLIPRGLDAEARAGWQDRIGKAIDAVDAACDSELARLSPGNRRR
jgi:hypothetical protein